MYVLDRSFYEGAVHIAKPDHAILLELPFWRQRSNSGLCPKRGINKRSLLTPKFDIEINEQCFPKTFWEKVPKYVEGTQNWPLSSTGSPSYIVSYWFTEIDRSVALLMCCMYYVYSTFLSPCNLCRYLRKYIRMQIYTITNMHNYRYVQIYALTNM